MAIGPISTFDTFSRTQTGQWGFTDNVGEGDNRNNWFGEDSGHWSVSASLGQAEINSFSDFPNYDLAYIKLPDEGIPYTQKQRILTKIKWTGIAGNPASDHGPALMVEDPDNFIMVSIRDSANAVGIKSCVSGVFYDHGAATFTLIKDTWYWVKFEQDFSMFYVKIWPASVHEPSAWTYQAQIGPLVQRIGSPPINKNWGYESRGTSQNYTAEIDTFYGYTLAEDAETGQINDNFNRTVDRKSVE